MSIIISLLAERKVCYNCIVPVKYLIFLLILTKPGCFEQPTEPVKIKTILQRKSKFAVTLPLCFEIIS